MMLAHRSHLYRAVGFSALLLTAWGLSVAPSHAQLVFESPLEDDLTVSPVMESPVKSPEMASPLDDAPVFESPLESASPPVPAASPVPAALPVPTASPQHGSAFPDFEPVWGGPAYVDEPPALEAIPNQLGGRSPGFAHPAPAVELNPNYGAPLIESPLEEENGNSQPTATTTPQDSFPSLQPAPQAGAAPSAIGSGANPNSGGAFGTEPFLGQPPHLQLDEPPQKPENAAGSSSEPQPFADVSKKSPKDTGYPKLEPTPAAKHPDLTLDTGNYSGWWDAMVSQPLRGAAQPNQVSIGELVYSALQHSARVRVISDTPLIRDTAVIESDANFDWGIFLETAWNDINDPVGSTLTTGGPPRFQDEQLTYDYGFQKRNRVGGEFSVSQQYGWQQSNSIFFIPNNQGTARLTLNYTQPLMRGSGLLYNTSTVVLAQVNAGAARNEFSRELQSYLTEVTEAYWTLYRERGSLLQRQRLFKRGEAIMRQLEVREGLDAVANQVVRAKAAVASRKADLFRAAASVKNAEGQIRALVNSPELGVLDEFELLPIDPPSREEISVTMHDAIEAAVRNRPELHQAMKEIHAASVRLDVSRNELLPVLDFVINSYVSGLRGDASIGRAFTDQFNTGSPSYSTGLRFEYPIGNRAAKARNQRRVLELRQLQNQFRNTLHLLQLEVETAMRETTTTYREVAANHQAMEAAQGEVELLTDRWKLLPGDDRSASLLLEDLLAAQERLALQEFGLLTAQVDYSISLVNLKRATGTLLQFENISVSRGQSGGVPELHLDRVAPVNYSTPVGR